MPCARTSKGSAGLIGLPGGIYLGAQDDEGGRVETIGARLALLQPPIPPHGQERLRPRVSPPSPNRFSDRFSGELKRGARRAFACVCGADAGGARRCTSTRQLTGGQVVEAAHMPEWLFSPSK